MTAQDFKLIAELLRHPPLDGQHRREMAEDIATTLQARYPRFDRAKFLTAALPTGASNVR